MVGQNYWVYVNKTVTRVLTHAGDCTFCQHGQGLHNGRRIATSQAKNWWAGPFGAYREAWAYATVEAHKLGTEPSEGRCCNPSSR